MTETGRVLGRLLLSVIFVEGGWNTLRDPQSRAVAVEQAGLPYPLQLTKFNAAAQVAGGLALAVGVLPRLTSLLLGASLVPTTVVGHAFWRHDHPMRRTLDRIGFLKNASVLGGLLLVAVDADEQAKAGRA